MKRKGLFWFLILEVSILWTHCSRPPAPGRSARWQWCEHMLEQTAHPMVKWQQKKKRNEAGSYSSLWDHTSNVLRNYALVPKIPSTPALPDNKPSMGEFLVYATNFQITTLIV